MRNYAARLDNTLYAEMRRLAVADLLIIQDFALRPLDPTQTNDCSQTPPGVPCP